MTTESIYNKVIEAIYEACYQESISENKRNTIIEYVARALEVGENKEA